MIVPCIDLMDGKVVQLRQGREKVLEGKTPKEMLEMFSGFPELQAIDLDAAMGRGSNSETLRYIARHATVRAGGGVRTFERARELVADGAARIIIGTAAFDQSGANLSFLQSVAEAVGVDRVVLALDSKDGKIVVKGWRESTRWTALEIVKSLEPYCYGFLCTYVDKEGMMQGTDLSWFESLRAATAKHITAAGGITTMDDVRALTAMNIDCAIGMSIYTGRLSIGELREFNYLQAR